MIKTVILDEPIWRSRLGRRAGELVRTYPVTSRIYSDRIAGSDPFPALDIDVIAFHPAGGIGGIDQDAESIVVEGVADQEIRVGHGIALFRRDGGGRSARNPEAGMVERLGIFYIDGSADGAGRQRRVRRLHHIDLADKVGAHGAEVEHTAVDVR